MDPTGRAIIISQDITRVIGSHITFTGDLTQRFGPDLHFAPGAFQSLLTEISMALNGDARLHLLTPFDWTTLPPDPSTGLTFAQTFYNQSVLNLVKVIDGILSHFPYE
jgi:hypothetical protein